MRFIKYLSITSLFLLLGACATVEDDPTADWSAEQLYNEARSALDSGNYELAIENYTKLESRYPYGRYAQQAQLETIYTHYKAGEASSAVAAADRFIKFHPRHPNVDYAYYLRGLATFEQSGDFISNLLGNDPANRDPASVRESFNYFKELISRFPNSQYSPDALNRMTQLRNTLARHEMYAADYYLKRGVYLAAVNRAKYVLENYQRSTAIPDALALMVRAYRKMGQQQLADDALLVLKQNHKDHPALAELRQQGTDKP